MEKNGTQKIISNIILESRERMTVSGVIEVESFDENSIILDTELGTLIIKGQVLKIGKLNLDSGEVLAEGEFDSFEYTAETTHRGGFFSRMFQ